VNISYDLFFIFLLLRVAGGVGAWGGGASAHRGFWGGGGSAPQTGPKEGGISDPPSKFGRRPKKDGILVKI